MKEEKDVIWYDRKRTFLGLPLSFTTYTLKEDKLLIKRGFLDIKEEEIRLYRIMDVTLSCKLGQRIFGIGTIHCCSADKSTPEFDILNVKKPKKVKELLSDKIEEERMRKRISGREYMTAEDEFDNDGIN